MKSLEIFSKKGSSIGFDLGSEWLKLVKVRPGRGGCVLESLVRCPWQAGDLDSNASMAKKISGVWSSSALKERSVVSSMAGHSVIVKRVSFTADSPRELPDVIMKDARQYIPFDIEDVYLDYQILGPGQKEKTYDVLLVASKKKVVQNLNDVLRLAGLSLSVVDVDSFSVCNSFEYNYPEYLDKTVYLLDVGGTQSVFCIYSNAQPVFLREVSFGGRALTDQVATVLNKQRTEAEHIKINGSDEMADNEAVLVSEAMQRTIKGWSEEIKRLIGFYQTSAGVESPAQDLFLSGGGVLLKGLGHLFRDELDMTVHFHDPFKNVVVDKNLFDSNYLREIGPQMVVPFGLSLRAL